VSILDDDFAVFERGEADIPFPFSIDELYLFRGERIFTIK